MTGWTYVRTEAYPRMTPVTGWPLPRYHYSTDTCLSYSTRPSSTRLYGVMWWVGYNRPRPMLLFMAMHLVHMLLVWVKRVVGQKRKIIKTSILIIVVIVVVI